MADELFGDAAGEDAKEPPLEGMAVRDAVLVLAALGV